MNPFTFGATFLFFSLLRILFIWNGWYGEKIKWKSAMCSVRKFCFLFKITVPNVLKWNQDPSLVWRYSILECISISSMPAKWKNRNTNIKFKLIRWFCIRWNVSLANWKKWKKNSCQYWGRINWYLVVTFFFFCSFPFPIPFFVSNTLLPEPDRERENKTK